MITYFSQAMPLAATELEYTSPYELIVAVILSAQCTDKRVNMITPAFFGKFPDVHSLAASAQEEVFDLIKSCSYPNNKVRHLLGMARMVVERFDGRIPDHLEELRSLPGVGRKTANVVLSVAFGRPAMPVDTHVFRVASRIGLTTGVKSPFQAELQLVRHIPGEKLHLAHHWLILHGRYVCTARNPACERCGLQEVCNFYQKKKKP